MEITYNFRLQIFIGSVLKSTDHWSSRLSVNHKPIMITQSYEEKRRYIGNEPAIICNTVTKLFLNLHQVHCSIMTNRLRTRNMSIKEKSSWTMYVKSSVYEKPKGVHQQKQSDVSISNIIPRRPKLS